MKAGTTSISALMKSSSSMTVPSSQQPEDGLFYRLLLLAQEGHAAEENGQLLALYRLGEFFLVLVLP